MGWVLLICLAGEKKAELSIFFGLVCCFLFFEGGAGGEKKGGTNFQSFAFEGKETWARQAEAAFRSAQGTRFLTAYPSASWTMRAPRGKLQLCRKAYKLLYFLFGFNVIQTF